MRGACRRLGLTVDWVRKVRIVEIPLDVEAALRDTIARMPDLELLCLVVHSDRPPSEHYYNVVLAMKELRPDVRVKREVCAWSFE